MMWIALLLSVTLISAYFRLPLLVWSILLGAGLALLQIYANVSFAQNTLLWALFAAIVIPLNVRKIRRNLFSKAVYKAMKKSYADNLTD